MVDGGFTINLRNAERDGGLLWGQAAAKERLMSRMSYRLAKAVSEGRMARGRPGSREEVLSRLLVKRAVAHRAGLRELEAALREQISWALPIRDGEAGEEAAEKPA